MGETYDARMIDRNDRGECAMKDELLNDTIDPDEDREYYQLQREEDALWIELGERAWYPLVYGDVRFDLDTDPR
jgi:hypothetical protein